MPRGEEEMMAMGRTSIDTPLAHLRRPLFLPNGFHTRGHDAQDIRPH